jgi:hypothetical protein
MWMSGFRLDGIPGSSQYLDQMWSYEGSDMSAFRPPAPGPEWMFDYRADGYHYCRLCNACATSDNGHLTSGKHLKRCLQDHCHFVGRCVGLFRVHVSAHMSFCCFQANPAVVVHGREADSTRCLDVLAVIRGLVFSSLEFHSAFAACIDGYFQISLGL